MITCSCGKQFMSRKKWLYKYKGRTYCSYTCWRNAGGGNKRFYAKADKF